MHHHLQAASDALVALDRVLTRAAATFGETRLLSNHPYFGGMSVLLTKN